MRDATTSAPISGAVVTVHGSQKSGSTDGSGMFTISDLPIGPVTLDVSAGGYTTQTQQVTLQANQTTNVTYALAPSQVSAPSRSP